MLKKNLLKKLWHEEEKKKLWTLKSWNWKNAIKIVSNFLVENIFAVQRFSFDTLHFDPFCVSNRTFIITHSAYLSSIAPTETN